LLAAVLLAACTQHSQSWNKTGTTAADVERDMKACKYEAYRSTDQASATSSEIMGTPQFILDLQQMCMEARGYRRS
jgi:hypothetical protein